MTEREFNETINNMYDIYDFCTANPKYDYITDDIYANEDMVEYLKDLIQDIKFESVQELINFTCGIPFSDWYYVQDGAVYELDFEELKNDLSGVLSYDGFFTNEELINKEDNNDNNNNNTDTDDDIITSDISLLYAEGWMYD